MISLPQLQPRFDRDSESTPNEKIHSLTGRPYVSYSQIKSFQRCPAQWHFRYVEKAPDEQVSAALVLGSCVHATIEAHYQALLANDTQPSTHELMGVFEHRWQSETDSKPVTYPRGQDYEKTKQLAERMVEVFLSSPYAQPDGEVIGLEESFRIKLADDLPDMVGRVDMLTYKDGVLQLTDFKTARAVWNINTANDNSDQLAIYSLGMHDLATSLDARITLRFVIATKTKEPKIEAIPIEIDTDRLDRTTKVIRQVVTAMHHGTIYPNPSPINCTTCPFQQRCGTWHH